MQTMVKSIQAWDMFLRYAYATMVIDKQGGTINRTCMNQSS